MVESLSLTEGLRRLSIGRIIYCVVASLPIAISLSLWLDPSEDNLATGMLVLLVLILTIPIMIVGIAILVRKKIKREPLLFWSVAVFIASTPIISLIAMVALNELTTIRIPQ